MSMDSCFPLGLIHSCVFFISSRHDHHMMMYNYTTVSNEKVYSCSIKVEYINHNYATGRYATKLSPNIQALESSFLQEHGYTCIKIHIIQCTYVLCYTNKEPLIDTTSFKGTTNTFKFQDVALQSP